MESKRQLRLHNQPLLTQLEINDFTVENTIKPAENKAAASKKGSKKK